MLHCGMQAVRTSFDEVCSRINAVCIEEILSMGKVNKEGLSLCAVKGHMRCHDAGPGSMAAVCTECGRWAPMACLCCWQRHVDNNGDKNENENDGETVCSIVGMPRYTGQQLLACHECDVKASIPGTRSLPTKCVRISTVTYFIRYTTVGASQGCAITSQFMCMDDDISVGTCF